MASGGGQGDYGLSLSFATASGASNNSPFNVTGGGSSATKPNSLAFYLIIVVGVLVGLWILAGRKS